MRNVSITSMQFRVSDPELLWDRAARAYLRQAGNDRDGATTFLGKRASPNIKACIAELIEAGCGAAPFEIV